MSALAWLPVRLAVAAMICASLATMFMFRTMAVEQTHTLLMRAAASETFEQHRTRACTDGGRVDIGTPETATMRVRAYDPRGVALDGDPSPHIVGEIVRGSSRAISLSFWGFGGSAVALRREGPPSACPIATIEIIAGPARGRGAALLLVLVLIASFAAIGLSALVVLRPLSRRLGRLAVAAERIGEGDLHVPADTARDDVARITDALRSSHARIASARAAEEASRRALEEHLRDVAHDLRTPVSSLSLALERAQRETEPEAREAAIQDALRDATYLGGLVANLELETRVKGRALRSVRVDLRETVSAAVARGRALGAPTLEVEYAVSDDAVLRELDPVAFERAISNLIENALRHGARRVGVVLSVDDGRYCVAVQDDGEGDPSSLRPGRGLAITRQIADALGAELAFERTSEGLVAMLRERPPRTATHDAH